MPRTPEQEQEYQTLLAKQSGPGPQEQVVSAVQFGEEPDPQKEALRQEYAMLQSKALQHTINTVMDAGTEAIKGAVAPLLRVPKIAEEERVAARDTIQKAIDDPTLGNIGNAALAIPRYVYSPVTGVARALAGEPFKNAATELGAPDWLAETIGNSAELGVQALSGKSIYLRALRLRSPEAQAIQRTEQINKLVSPPTTITPGKVKTPEGMPSGATKLTSEEEALKGLDKFDSTYTQGQEEARNAISAAKIPEMAKSESDVLKPYLKEDWIKQITEGAQAEGGMLDTKQRIFKRLSEHLTLRELQIEDLPDVLKKWDLQPAEFSKMYEDAVSSGARILSYHSRAAKRLNAVFGKEPEAMQRLAAALQAEKPERYMLDKITDTLYDVDNWRRRLLITQVATAARNAVTQGGNTVLGAFDEALQGVVRGAVGGGGKVEFMDEVRNGLNNFHSVFSVFSKDKWGKLGEMLEQENAALTKARMLSVPVAESVGGKVANAVSYLNQTQEVFFRKLAFESKMRQLIQKAGFDWNTIDPKMIPKELFQQAGDYALEMTWSAAPKSQFARQWINAWQKVGLTTVNPFPRYNFANAIPFVLEHSPLGYLQAFSPSTIKALASGNPDKFAKAASKATLGTLMLDSAMRIRQSEHAGEKYNELKVADNKTTGGSTIFDTRPYNPFSTYLFIAEAMTHPEKLTTTDWMQNIIGINRIAGSGLAIVDMLHAKSGEPMVKQLKNVVGQLMSGFTVPFRQFSDVYSAMDKEESLLREYRMDPLKAPSMMSIPGLSKTVPEKYSVTSSKRMYKGEDVLLDGVRIPAGILRQATGMSFRNKNIVDREIDRVGMDWMYAIPRTGVPEADNMTRKYMGPIVEKVAPMLFKADAYKNAPSNTLKEKMLRAMFVYARGQATKELAQKNPDLFLKMKVSRDISDIDKKILTEMGVQLPGREE